MVVRSKYKPLRILFNFLLWIMFTFIFYNVSGFPDEKSLNYVRLINTIVIMTVVYYLNYYILIPNFLSKRKFKLYGLSIIGTLAVIFIVSFYTAKPLGDAFHDLGNESFRENMPPLSSIPRKPFFFNYGIVILSTISFAVSTSIKVTSEWFKNENQLRENENQRLLAELSYLKAQINPHFFFNILNGIYALAIQKSDKTPEVIMKLSVIMRYIIYDANEPVVPLKKELKHIANYIDLQKMRLTDIVNVKYTVTGNSKNIMIEPLLFSVFVENAFKHGIDYSKECEICFNLDINEGELKFMAKNPIVEKKQKPNSSESGIGLENIKKRLELLYPNKHELNITESDQHHKVELKLNTTTI